MRENSFHTNQKLTKWHLWFSLPHSPYLLGVAAHVFRATLACRVVSEAGNRSLTGKHFISKRWSSPLERKAPPSCRAAGVPGGGGGVLIAASVDALQRVPCKRGGESGKEEWG